MKKLILVILAVSMCAGIAMAGNTWDYAWPNNSISKNFDSLNMVTTVKDTTVQFWFKKNNSEIQVFMDTRHKNATLTTLPLPKIEYKWIGGDGNQYGVDSASAWITLVDTCHVTISAAGHCYYKKYISNKTGVRGIIFKGGLVGSAADSAVTRIRVQE